VVWQSYDNGSDNDIRGRFVDMETGLPVGNDFLVSTSNSNSQSSPQLSISGNRALVVWISYNGSDSDIRGRFVNMDTGLPVGSDFLVSNSNSHSQSQQKLSISGSRALVVWYSYNGSNSDVRGRIVNMETGLPVGSDFLVSTTNVNNQRDPDLSVSGSRALVVWRSDENSSDYEIHGRIVDMGTGSPIGSDFSVSTSNENTQYPPEVSISGSRALVVWQSYDNGSDNDIRGRFVDMKTGLPVDVDFLVSTTNANNQNEPQLSISGSRALVVWESRENGNDSNIWGRFLNMTTGLPEGSDFRISTNNLNSQYRLQLSISASRALIVWQSTDNGFDNEIRGRLFHFNGHDLPNGLNNFFISPLIERDYEVRARIVE
jgi:hypothetical protein